MPSTYDAFCKAENITHEAVNLSQGQRVIKRTYHVQNVNAYHSRFKSWLGHFHGVATKYLPNYLGWCRVMDEYHNLTPEMLLNSALGDFQHLPVALYQEFLPTYKLQGKSASKSLIVVDHQLLLTP